MTTANLHILEDADGRRMTVGDLQIAWLLKHGHVELVSTMPTSALTAVEIYRPVTLGSIDEVNAIVLGNPALRECDFCRAVPSAWRVNVRPFDSPIGPGGRFERPVFVCDVCVPFVRERDREALVQRLIGGALDAAGRMGGDMATVVGTITDREIEHHVAPQLRAFATAVLSHRKGWPERDEGQP